MKVNTACRSIGFVKSYGGKVKKLQTDFLKIMEWYMMQLTVLVDNNTLIDRYYLGEPA